MNFPNLASRPFLNIRPVRILSLGALLLALLFGAIDFNIYSRSTRDLTTQIEERDSLKARRTELIQQLQEHLNALDGVPWKGLSRRITSVNSILGEQHFSWGRLLDDLGEVLPWQVRMVSVSPSHDEDGIRLSIRAVSQDRDGFLAFLDNLVEDPRFEEPIPARETWPESGQTIEYLFSLRVQYRPEGSEE